MEANPLSWDAPRWERLVGGYRRPYDPRDALRELESGDVEAAWHELWDELHHQGDVGDASFAAVPHLVRIHAMRGNADWNTYHLIFTIEAARSRSENPEVPDVLRAAYETALDQLVRLGLAELPEATAPELVSGILAVLAQAKGHRALAQLAVGFTDEELERLTSQALD